MAEPSAVAPGIVPFEVRPQLALGVSPLAWGVLVAAVLMAGAVAFALAYDGLGLGRGGAPAGLEFATRVALIASLTIGYTLAVWSWVPSAQHRDFTELGIEDGGVDPVGDPVSVYAASPGRLRRSRLAGLAGVFLFVLTIEVPTALAGGSAGEAWVNLHPLTYMLGLGVIFFWVAGRAAYFSIGRHVFQTALDRLDVDLLDRRPFRVFGRIALRNALVWVIGFSIATLAFANPELRFAGSLVVFVPLTLVTIAVASAAMLLPMRGLHVRIVAAKQAELARVEAAIRGDTAALQGSRIAGREPPPSLADLIAYKGLIESAPEWPFDGSTLRRFGLYLLIPLASWVGGALVERGVSAVLD